MCAFPIASSLCAAVTVESKKKLPRELKTQTLHASPTLQPLKHYEEQVHLMNEQ
jgi:hypothetical protein